MLPRRPAKTRRDMFGRPIETDGSKPDQVPTARQVVPTAQRAASDQQNPYGIERWGTRASLDLAGAPGKVQSVIADLWSQWWRPWALVGLLVAVIAIVLVIQGATS